MMTNYYDVATNNGVEGMIIESVKCLGDITPEVNVFIAESLYAMARLTEVGMNHLDEANLDDKLVDFEVIEYLIDAFKASSSGIFRHEATQLVSNT